MCVSTLSGRPTPACARANGVSHTVLNPEKKGFTEVECEVIETFGADQVMSKSDITDWGATQAQKHVTVYNRPARLRRIYGSTAKVVWDDVGTIGFVSTDQLEGRANE